jgi:hypothetical protein
VVHSCSCDRLCQADGMSLLTCHRDDIPAAPFHLIAAEQNARRFRHQGLGQRCRRPDLLGPSLR